MRPAVGDGVRGLSGLLARRRPLGVALALAAEAGALAGLAEASPSAALGLPAAVATAIGGTVAVVYGLLDGVAVAFAGALVFAATGGWRAGELAALAVWPAIVAAAGLFARRVEQRRRVLGHVLEAREEERRRLALELHDDTAQALAGALLTLRAADRAAGAPAAAEAAERARELINRTIQDLRALAVDLSPKALEDHGLAPTLERLADTLAERTGLDVEIDARWSGRASGDVELALYRVVQDALAEAVAAEAERVRVVLERSGGTVAVAVDREGGRLDGATRTEREAQRERLRLLGGTLTSAALPGGGRRLRAEAPARSG